MATARRRLSELFDGDGLPGASDLPRWLAPLPRPIENLGLNLVPLVVVTNLVGTAFGFWYYGFQFSIEPVVMWPFVPDSPVATLFIALAFGAWYLGRSNEYLNALAFFGCLKLGAWTPFVLLAFREDFSYLHPAMYNFLFWSHLAMVVEAFVIHRFSGFPIRAVLVAVVWYGFNDLVDYFVPLVGGPHHTLIPAEPIVDGVVQHVSPAHELAAAGAVVLTLAATFLALSTRVKQLEAVQ
ncbi:DUF1405 domain-containing protein [Salinigranum salinum]|uniref:DUF1405 domain-containing protein n=1 Tax=Salinigranum salinum TaxID=1364937 RepID=UPI00126072E0|nr:DUF1405 domain-containing protein [Salinigranum salinum]